jgi:hypothetical protein
MMKFKRKIMLFEEFEASHTTAAANSFSKIGAKSNTTVDVDRLKQSSTVKTEIVKDVDSIINKLEYLASNIDSGVESTNESQLNEGASAGAVDQIVSAELYMIPIIAAGIVGTATVGTGILIKRALTKKKIRSKYKKSVKSNKIKAAKMEIYLKKLRDYKNQDFDEKSKQKIEEFNKKIKELKDSAEDVNSALLDKYSNYTSFIGTLNSETRMEIAELMLDSKALSDSEKERYEKTYKNAVRSLDRRLKKAEEEKKAAEEAVKNASKEDLAKIKAEKERLKQELEDKKDNSEKDDN